MTDPISDMLNRIKNAQNAGKESVQAPFSLYLLAVAKALEQRGFLKSVDTKGRKGKKLLEMQLKYHDNAPAISGFKRVSKPGQRQYTGFLRLRAVKGGHGVALLSTSKGVMSENEARKQKIGGELLCEVW